MALPADFSKIFGSTATGGLTPIGDVNYAKGWEFVGSTPPTKNDFSYLQNLSDLKSKWLYSNKLQRTDPFGDIKSDGAAAVSKAHANLGLGEAAKRGVGTGSNQLPDMSAFGMSRNEQTAWDILPNGMIRQAGTVTLTPVGNFNAQVLGGVTYYTHYYRVNFPRQFPNAQIATLATLASYPYSNQATMAGKSLSTHRDTDSGADVSRTRFTVAYTTPNLGEIPTLHFESIGY